MKNEIILKKYFTFYSILLSVLFPAIIYSFMGKNKCEIVRAEEIGDNRITITFHSNYPDGSVNSTSGLETYVHQPVNLHINDFSFDGYTLMGWCSDVNDTSIMIEYDDNTSHAFDKGIDLYACWRKNITITYDAGEGKFIDGTTKKYNTTCENISNYSFSLSNPQKEGAMFLGWFVPEISKEGIVSTYYNSSSAASLKTDKNITLTAIYSSDFYTLTFDANGGYFDGDKSKTVKEYSVVSEKNFHDCTGEFDPKPQYENNEKYFVGWKRSDDETNQIESSIWMDKYSENITFEAVWADYHDVTFDAGDGYFKIDSSKEKTTTVRVGDGKNVSSSIVPTIYNDNNVMICIGWKKTGIEDEKIYSKDDIANYNNKVYEDLTYEAVWVDSSDETQKDKLAKITFDAGEGLLQGKATSVYTYTVPKNSSVYSFYGSYGVQAYRDGFSFRCWKIKGDDSGKEYSYFSASEYQAEQDITFEAEWSLTHTVTFDLGEDYYGYFGSDRYITGNFGENEPVYMNLDHSHIPYEGFLMAGDMCLVQWKSDDGKLYDAYNTRVYDPQTYDVLYALKDMNLTAIWKKKIRVTFETSISSFEYNNSKKTVIDVVPGVKLSSNSNSPSSSDIIPYLNPIDGYVFKGWKEKGNNNSKIYTCRNDGMYEENDIGYYIPESDITFEAVWDTTHKVTFLSEDGYISGSSSRTTYESVVDNDSYLSYVPTCSGRQKWIFRGWKVDGDAKLYIDKSYSLKNNEADIKQYRITKDVTFKAVWEESCMITFYSEEGYFSGKSTNKSISVNVEIGQKYTSYVSGPYNRPGYVFAGWKLRGDTSDDIYQKKYSDDIGISKNISDLEIREDIIFDAVWDEAVTATFVSPDGYIGGSSGTKKSETVVRKGKPIGSTYNYGNNRKGYIFAGWKKEGDNTLYVQKQEEAVNGAKWINEFVPTSDVTFNLVWICVKNVTIDSKEGYVNGSKYEYSKTFQVNAGEKLTTLPVKVYGRTGYSVKGYKIKEDASGMLYVENINEYNGQENVKSIYDYVVESDITLEVQWMEGYEVKFISDEGYLNGNKVDTEMIVSISADSEGAIKTLPAPKWEGYVLKGFTVKEGGSGDSTNTIYVLNQNEASELENKVYIGDYKVTTDVTFKALWEKDFAKLLKAAKDNAKAQLDEYAESKRLADATEKETKTYNDTVTAGKAIIDSAEDEAAIDSKLAEAKGKIDDIIVTIKVDRQKAEDEANQKNKNGEEPKTTNPSNPGGSGTNPATQNPNNGKNNKTTKPTVKKPVVKKKQTIKAKSKKLYYSDKAVSLGVKTTGNGKLTFKSSNPKVIKIAKNGKVKTVGLGKATITIKAAGTSKFKPATKKITVTVVCAKQVIKSKIQWGNRVKLSWVKDKTVDGYEVQFSIDKKFDEKKTIHNFFKKNVNSTLIKPNGNYTRTYYVRVRSYRIVKGKKVFNDWSKTCTVNLN